MQKFRSNLFLISGILLGAAGGYIYWYFWGCTDGCSIRSVWWRMSIWGAIMGGLLFSMLKDEMIRRSKSN